ncbi:MAG: NADP-dependent phosphogluconate dehydrogenase, partial [Candidatus Omnitrophica bacterium]|nr:NADP-dependent phosphogluconate dehydrogenase [Candidatus Omnitrophota bacterium]
SIMPGGPKEAYERVRPLLEAAASHVDGKPCVAHLGPGSSGHFVKMVHNGIEYGIMQILAESFHLLKSGAGLDDDRIHQIFSDWNQGELQSYLIEITGRIFNRKDKKTGKPLIDIILDVAKQKGTGMWTSQSAMELEVPTPVIDSAVAMRNLSTYEQERDRASAVLDRKPVAFQSDTDAFVRQLEEAVLAAMIVAYSQGFALLRKASSKYSFDLDLSVVARVWKGGCIIRSALLEDIQNAFEKDPNLPNLLLDPGISKKVMESQEGLRVIVSEACLLGIPAPAFMATLGYLDGYRSAWLPANLIQAQRDYFGSHCYERIDSKGTYHTEWEDEAK